VNVWRSRYAEAGIAGLADLTRPGRDHYGHPGLRRRPWG
jgi:hypothetical protein